MDREILFRGKRVDNGEWVYGSIVHQTDYYGDKCDRWFILEGDCTNDYDIDYPIEVQKETVGQYTGLNDKKGLTKIFEGDIVLHKSWTESHENGVVKMEYGAWVVWEDGDHYEPLDYSANCVPGYERCEVVGNIHDNPELLRGETQ